MPISSPAYSSAMSGLAAASRRFEVSATRLAQSSTEGFSPYEEARVTLSDEARGQGADGAMTIVEETVAQMTSAFAFRANLRTLRTAQELDATLLALGAPDDR
jgi:flagellar basal body rod protein FlgC